MNTNLKFIYIVLLSNHRFEERNTEKARRKSELQEKWAKNKKLQASQRSEQSTFSRNKLASGKSEKKNDWWAS